MDKTLAGLLGAVGSLAAIAPSNALTVPPLDDVMHASTYADLLRPIPNATALLEAANAKAAAAPTAEPELMQVQYYHHHHHHHHNYYRRPVYGYGYGYPRYHHHHHHHVRRFFVPGVGWVIR